MDCPPVLSFDLNFMLVLGAGMALNESIMFLATPSLPFLHLEEFALATSMTALSVSFGIVATMIALRGISAFVL